MPTVRFRGRILPPSFHMTLPFVPYVVCKDGDLDYDMRYQIVIKDSLVTIDCEVDEYSRDEVARMALRAIDYSQACVDVVAFSMGGPAAISLETCTEPGGTEQALIINDADLAALCTAFSLTKPDFVQVLEIVIREPNLFHALRDLIEATSGAHKVIPHCAKAIDTLRNLLAPRGLSPKDKWPIMHEQLRVSESYLKLITDQSRGPRHGDHQAISGQVTDEVSKRSWTVMNRFLEFRKRGSQPLPLDEFPLLTG